ncbi:scaffold/adaptor protein [Lithospermum erythrorhizon]|uniref:Scaffold/adaptor protein n=1 Tax=Lithospermum erythrorhizon TaxID=34254 RepID=A0AAV3PTD8_LITER
MGRCSNNLVTILNIITLLLSIPIIAGGVWLSRQANTECERFLDKPVIALGVFILVVSLAGIIGSCFRVTWLLWVYLFVMFVLILLLTAFTIFAFVVTNKGAGESVSGRGYKEYRLGDYSNWLQKRVESNKNWNKIRSCLQDSKICQKLIDDGSNTKVEDFYQKHLSSLESGCCKPSDVCNFQYVSPTNWTPNTTSNATNPDCAAWSNDQNVLCYNCQSCKAGLLNNIKDQWRKVAILNVIFLVFLIIVYSVGCCAFRNNRNDSSYKRYP